MKSKPLMIILSFFLFSLSALGQYNYSQKLGSLATIMLPDTPKLVRAKGSEVYVSRYQGVIYMGQAGDVSEGLRNIFHKTSIDSLYSSYINGALTSTKGKLIYKDKIKIQDHDGFEFGYEAESNGQEIYRYSRLILLNDTILMCGVWSSDLVSKDNPNLNEFFKGFKTKSDQQLQTDRAAKLGHKTGHVVGILIILAIPVGIGLIIVFLIRKIIYRTKR